LLIQYQKSCKVETKINLPKTDVKEQMEVTNQKAEEQVHKDLMQTHSNVTLMSPESPFHSGFCSSDCWQQSKKIDNGWYQCLEKIYSMAIYRQYLNNNILAGIVVETTIN
jgi:hypothetical protein